MVGSSRRFLYRWPGTSPRLLHRWFFGYGSAFQMEQYRVFLPGGFLGAFGGSSTGALTARGCSSDGRIYVFLIIRLSLISGIVPPVGYTILIWETGARLFAQQATSNGVFHNNRTVSFHIPD